MMTMRSEGGRGREGGRADLMASCLLRLERLCSERVKGRCECVGARACFGFTESLILIHCIAALLLPKGATGRFYQYN
jgi:hypothetical protein